MSVKQLYLRAGDKVRGPFDVSQVREAARQGKVLPSHEGSADGQTWFRLETIWAKLVGEPAETSQAAAPKAAAPPAEPAAPPRALAASPVETRAAPPTPTLLRTAPASAFPPLSASSDDSMFVEASAPVRPKRPVLRDGLHRDDGPADSPAVSPAYGAAAKSVRPPDGSEAKHTTQEVRYDPRLYGALRIVLWFDMFLYALVALNGVMLFVALKFKILGDFAQLMLQTPLGRSLSSAAVLLDLVAGILMLVWSHKVFTQLRGFHPQHWPESFSRWAVGYFVPIVTIFTFSQFQSRLWHGSHAGWRRFAIRDSQPDVVATGVSLRMIVWISYFAMIGVGVWIARLAGEAAKTQGASPATRQASLNLELLSGTVQNAALILLFLLVVFGAASAAVVWSNYRFANTVHENMTAIEDLDDADSDDADSDAT